MQHSENHPMVTTGQRAIPIVLTALKLVCFYIARPFTSESANFEKKRLDDDDDSLMRATLPVILEARAQLRRCLGLEAVARLCSPVMDAVGVVIFPG